MRGFQIRPIAGDEASPADLVFVHGLTGHEVATWDRPRSFSERLLRMLASGRRDDTSDLWPSKLGSTARVWLAGYPSPLLELLHGGKISQAFEEEGEEALRALQKQKLGTKPIIFVAHSLGGLLVKSLLCRSAQQLSEDTKIGRPSIVNATGGVVFLGTPHAGSDRVRLRLWIPHLVRSLIAALALLLAFWDPIWVSTPIVVVGNLSVTGRVVVRAMSVVLVALTLWFLRSARHVNLLDPDNAELRTLREDFRKMLRERPSDARPIAVLAMYENRPTRYKGISLGILVPWWSADPGVEDCAPVPVHADHIEICKPEAVEASGLAEELRTLVGYVTSGTQTQVFGQMLTGLLNRSEHLQRIQRERLVRLIAGGQFEQIPTESSQRQLVEADLRAWLRWGIREKLLRPAAWQLRMAATSPFSVDRFVRAIWWDSQLASIPQELTGNALDEFRLWPKGNENWPTLITFYRALRTIDRAQNKVDTRLLKLATDAYNRLENAQNQLPPDETGATRWLLFKLECLGRLSAAGATFVGSNDCSEAEPPAVTLARQRMREEFSGILNRLEEALEAARERVEPHLRVTERGA